MASTTLTLPDDKHERLQRLAQSRGLSLDPLLDEWATRILAESEAKSRFLALASRGNPRRGLALLDKLDRLESEPGPGPE